MNVQVTIGDDIPTGAVPLMAADYQFEVVENEVTIKKDGLAVVTFRLFEAAS